MDPDILIPTCKDDWDLSGQLGELLSVSRDCEIYYSCTDASAAINRNKCLDMAKSEFVVMVDDDVSGFFPGWEQLMVAPLLKNSDIIYTSARLLNEDGSPQSVMGFSKDLKTENVLVNIAPSACIAFRNDGTRFNEDYIGSGFEDSSFHCRLGFKYHGEYWTEKRVVVCNNVKLIHHHEMKKQNVHHNHNKAIFMKEFPTVNMNFY